LTTLGGEVLFRPRAALVATRCRLVFFTIYSSAGAGATLLFDAVTPMLVRLTRMRHASPSVERFLFRGEPRAQLCRRAHPGKWVASACGPMSARRISLRRQPLAAPSEPARSFVASRRMLIPAARAL